MAFRPPFNALDETLPAEAGGDTEATFTISDLAAAFDLTPRSIRFYEDEGLLSPGRDGVARVYSRKDRARLALICRGKRLGFSLAEVREFLALYDVDEAQVEQMSYLLGRARCRIDALERQLADVRQTLGELRALEDAIVTHLDRHGADPDRRGGARSGRAVPDTDSRGSPS